MKVLVDTNILVYLYDNSDPDRQRRAAASLITSHEVVISTQVMIEFYAVATRKLGLAHSEAAAVLGQLTYPTIAADRDLVNQAMDLAADNQLSIFDAMIIAAAVAAGCDEVWTEDLNEGATIRGVRIVNPLLDAPQ